MAACVGKNPKTGSQGVKHTMSEVTLRIYVSRTVQPINDENKRKTRTLVIKRHDEEENVSSFRDC